jgi:hypothetical protein
MVMAEMFQILLFIFWNVPGNIKCNCDNFKKDEIKDSSIAWDEEIQSKKKNILSGFEVSGIHFAAMQARLKLFQDVGVNLRKFEAAPWITSREVVRTQIFLLPSAIDKVPKRRKTLDIQNRLLNKD